MKPRIFLILSVVIMCAAAAGAQTYLENSEAAAIGMTPAQAFNAFGAPETIYLQPGPAEWQDDIVFYFPDHSYLYWFDNRVWQVRFDRRHGDPVFGVFMGTPMHEVRGRLGPPLYEDSGELVYAVSESGFPVRTRMLFEDGLLTEIYIYRSDF